MGGQAMPVCETLLLRREGAVLHVQLNRPEVRNAMSLQMVDELRQTLQAAESDGQVRVVVLRGSDRHFCAGGDIRDMAAARMKLADAYVPRNDARVIAHTAVIGGGQTTEVVLPTSRLRKGGEYTFFCSFPGHWNMMKGTLVFE